MGPGCFIVFYPIAFIEGGVVGDFFTIIELALDNGVLKSFSDFKCLMGDKITSYDDVRNILVEKIELGDSSVLGLINKIKGQLVAFPKNGTKDFLFK